MNKKIDKINKKFLVKGKLKLVSPLCIGIGKDEYLDIKIIKDNEGNPFIPATSFIGALRASLGSYDIDSNILDKFFGDEEENQSSLICYNLELCSDYNTGYRDGVKINEETYTAEPNNKYNYEILEPDCEFKLEMEINIRHNNICEYEILKILRTIKHAIDNRYFMLGANTTDGFGRFEVAQFEYYSLDFKQKKDVEIWLNEEYESMRFKAINKDDIYKLNLNFLNLDLQVGIKTSLLIKSYNYTNNYPDAIHINFQQRDLDNNIYIIPASSVRGALRHRSREILDNIIYDNEEKKEKILDELWGYVHKEKKKKSKVYIEEGIVENIEVYVQPRIKINRFTGGTIETAYFDSAALFPKKDSLIEINIRISNPEDYEIGLLLHLIKDLWTGDLAIGGEKSIGRGVLLGKKVILKIGDKTYELEDFNNLDEKEKMDLENYAKRLCTYCEG